MSLYLAHSTNWGHFPYPQVGPVSSCHFGLCDVWKLGYATRHGRTNPGKLSTKNIDSSLTLLVPEMYNGQN